MSSNPYKTPEITTPTAELVELKTAGIGVRFLARCLDSVFAMVPVMVANSILHRVIDATPDYSTSAGVVSAFAYALVNIVLLVMRGQTLGKLICGIQIIDWQRSTLLGPFRIVLLRENWFLPLAILCFWRPEFFIILGTANWIDALCGLTDDRRCLHDYIACSRVVFYDPSRTTTHAGSQVEAAHTIRLNRTATETSWEVRQLTKRVECLQDLIGDGERSKFAATKIETVGMTPMDYYMKTVLAIDAFRNNNSGEANRKTAEEMLSRVSKIGKQLENANTQ